MTLEQMIISNLLYSEKYSRKVVPFLASEYFSDKVDKVTVEEILKFFYKYSKSPTKEVLIIEVASRKDISESELKSIVELIEGTTAVIVDENWMLTESEKFVKKRAVYNAILESISILDGKTKNKSEDSIPELLSSALGISFDTNVGHDYFVDLASRFEFYNRIEEGVLFDIDYLNKITGGVGLRKKTLTAILAPTGVGKSLVLVHVSASTLMQGHNVLYITSEMAEERIAERVDANLLNINIGYLKDLEKRAFDTKMGALMQRSKGKLIVKEYPTGTGHAGHFRALITELKAKKNFKPDLIVIDYLNICASQNIRPNSNSNSYTIVKSIAEEFRSLAMEFDVPVLTATQTNRDGVNNSNIEMTDTSESMGLAHTLDLYLALIRTEELDDQNQIMFKQLKNRYGDINFNKKFLVGVDRAKMKLYNLEESAQGGIVKPQYVAAQPPKVLKPTNFKF